MSLGSENISVTKISNGSVVLFGVIGAALVGNGNVFKFPIRSIARMEIGTDTDTTRRIYFSLKNGQNFAIIFPLERDCAEVYKWIESSLTSLAQKPVDDTNASEDEQAASGATLTTPKKNWGLWICLVILALIMRSCVSVALR